MTLDEPECWDRLERQRHGVLGTLHEQRGVDIVPVVFAVLSGHRIVVPVDTVKPKRTTTLQRVGNVERDRRCVLLVDYYDEDWTQLWWVRVHAHAAFTPVTADVAAALGARYPPYRRPGSVAAALVLTPVAVSGWSAGT